MIKLKLIEWAIRIVMFLIAIGLGIWYLSSSINGTAISYTSMDGFLGAIGAGENIADANGCFLCGYVGQLFGVIGRATEMFWTVLVENLWILMAVGFCVFVFIHSIKHILDATRQTAKLDGGEKTLELKPWFDKVWRQGARVLIVGALMGAIGMGGTAALRTVANITITPVLFVGSEMSMAASGISDATTCHVMDVSGTDGGVDILNPIMGPFMCVIGNLNTIVLAGAAGGFSLMNYAWMGLGGGAMTWIAGLGMVILFLIIGFNLFFQILSVVFKLVFLIIFLPVLLAAAAFEPVWKMASGLINRAIGTLVGCAVSIVSVTLKILIVYATITYAADAYFPGPYDGYSAILPPLMGRDMSAQNADARTNSVMAVFSECERVSLVDGLVDADKFQECFIARKAAVESQYPGAFDFMKNGFEFFLMMFGIWLLYTYAVEPRVNKILAPVDVGEFDFGGWIKGVGQTAWATPMKVFNWVAKVVTK